MPSSGSTSVAVLPASSTTNSGCPERVARGVDPGRRGEALRLDPLAPCVGRRDRVVARRERRCRRGGRRRRIADEHVEQLSAEVRAERRIKVRERDPDVDVVRVLVDLEPGEVECPGVEVRGRGIRVCARAVVIAGGIACIEHCCAGRTKFADRDLRVAGAPPRGGGDRDRGRAERDRERQRPVARGVGRRRGRAGRAAGWTPTASASTRAPRVVVPLTGPSRW